MNENIKKLRNNESECVKIARLSVEHFAKHKKVLSDYKVNNPQFLNSKAGVFVSIHKSNQLRGCIGTIQATKESIVEEIIANAISAANNDPRFYRVEYNELDELEYKVDILGGIEEVDDTTKLDVYRYGVIVSYLGRRALLLPNLEGINTVEEQLSIVCKKAGISVDSPYKLSRFEVVRYK